jgi:hypothetical protein
MVGSGFRNTYLNRSVSTRLLSLVSDYVTNQGLTCSASLEFVLRPAMLCNPAVKMDLESRRISMNEIDDLLQRNKEFAVQQSATGTLMPSLP